MLNVSVLFTWYMYSFAEWLVCFESVDFMFEPWQDSVQNKDVVAMLLSISLIPSLDENEIIWLLNY